MLFGLSTFAQGPDDAVSPLERLRDRSAEARWREQRVQWSPLPEVEQEVVETREPASAGTEPAPAAPPESNPAVSDPMPGSAAQSHPVPARPSGHARVLDLFMEPGDTPPAPARNREQISNRQTGEFSEAHAPRGAIARPGRPAVRALPLPEFLAGADPAWISPTPAAPRRDQRVETLQGAGSQLIAVQNQFVEPADAPTRGVLRPITEINPFFDYDPDGGDPCEHLCPVPTAICETEDVLCPAVEPLPVSKPAERYFAHMHYFWAASDVYYNPLYFEDPALERYGHVHIHDAVQPFVSVARFGGQLIGLPYQMALAPVHDRVYPLGYYRPGDPAPKLIYQPPLNARAATTAAGVYTGFFLLVP